MPWPTRHSQRFTPPTCSLEISARVSALSQWSDRPVWKQVRFQLQFDDPRLTADHHRVVRGNRRQLEALVQVVDDYVQGQLGVPGQVGQSIPTAIANRGELLGVAIAAPAAVAPLSPPPPLPEPAFGLSLRHYGLTQHELVLGDLATAESGATVRLNTTQLFDLATALDEYQTAGLSLPTLARSPQRWQQWGAIAASVLIAVAVAPSVYRRVTTPTVVMSESTLTEPAPSDRNAIVTGPERAPIQPDALKPQDIPPDPTTLQPLPPLTATPNAAPVPAPSAAPAAPAAGAPAPAPAAPPAPSDRPPALPQLEVAPLPANSGAARSAAPAPMADAAAESTAITPPAPTTPSATSSTLFDRQPQVAEARAYLEQRWSPPAELTQTLEYRVSVAPDGTIQQISPLGEASARYQAQSGLPNPGDRLVSPVAGEQSLRLRVVLSPNGTVRTFQE